MARPTDLTDPFVQTALVEAEQALDTGTTCGLSASASRSTAVSRSSGPR